MSLHLSLNASPGSLSKEKCSPQLVSSPFSLLTMELLQLSVCHCDLFTDGALAVMISMRSLCVPMVSHNDLYSP